MDFNKKFTPETWPDHPEKATLEGKNKFVRFLALPWWRNSIYLQVCLQLI